MECKKTEYSKYISLINVISNPEKYHGKGLILKGYLSIENLTAPTLAYLYVSRDDLDYGITKNALVINWPSSFRASVLSSNLSYILIEGQFDKSKLGPWSLYSGGLDCIERVDKIEKRSSVLKE